MSYCTIIAPDLKHLNEVYSNLRKIGKWSIDKVCNLDNKECSDNLTNMQKKVLMTAKGMGYFENKHKTSIEDVGKALAISKSTAHHHLREATKKIVERYVDEANLKEY